MGSIAALLGRLQGVFGKTFLMAGVLPALVLILGLEWYLEGPSGVEDLFVHFTAADKIVDADGRANSAGASPHPVHTESETAQVVGVMVFRIVLLLGSGLFFFAIRHLVLTVYQSFPSPQRVRQFLIDRQDVRRRKIECREKLLSLVYTATRWPIDAFPIPPHRVPTYWPESATEVQRKSQLGWDALRRAADRHGEVPIVRHREYQLISDAIMSHYLYASSEKSLHPNLIDHWRQLMTDDTVNGLRKKATYEVCVERASRLWTRAASLKKNYPSPDYVMPTMLGTRLAALDEYAEARYGIDTTTLWLRLWGLLSKEERSEVADAQTSVQCLLNLATALLVISVYVLATDLWHVRHLIWKRQVDFDARIAAFIILPLILSRFSYMSAVFAAVAFSERVTRYLDLYWLRFLKALGYRLQPEANAAAALSILRGLGAFYLAADSRGIGDRTIEYETAVAKDDPGASKADETKSKNSDGAVGSG